MHQKIFFELLRRLKPCRSFYKGLAALILLANGIGSNCQAQEKNFVLIDPDDTGDSIISKAARVVPSARQLLWQKLELTAFFHFGINTFTNREWGTGKEDPRLFDPTSLDAMQWVKVAKEAGIRQVILTAKHHDGFCLWPTQTTRHSVAASPWKGGKGDVVKEVADACRKLKVGFGLYLSPWDMHAPSYGTDAYNELFAAQLTELLTRYGQVDELWFDGANGEGPNGKKQVYNFEHWYSLIRKLQPKAVIAIMGPDVRWVGTETGYGREQEWSVVPADNLDQATITSRSQASISFKPQGDMRGDDLGSRSQIYKAKGLVWYPAETDVSIRPGWFYHPEEDEKVKTPEKLLDIYFHSVGRNGVLLLNIPPDKRGLVNDHDIRALKEWKRLREGIFKNNLAIGARITSANGSGHRYLTDGNDQSWFTTNGWDTATVLMIQLAGQRTFDVLMLQEHIARGQRIEAFALDIEVNKEWQQVTAGTTVGYRRLLRFPAVTTSRLRLRIGSSRLNPMLSEIGIYKQPSPTLKK